MNTFTATVGSQGIIMTVEASSQPTMFLTRDEALSLREAIDSCIGQMAVSTSQMLEAQMVEARPDSSQHYRHPHND